MAALERWRCLHLEALAISRNTLEAWIPEEWGGPVITTINQISVIENLARRVPMSSDTRHVARDGGVEVEGLNKGGPYGEDESINDEVLLHAKKFGKAIRLADEDLNDVNYIDIIRQKQLGWARSYAKLIDNACLAVTAAASSPVRHFNSLYYQLSQTNNDTGYTGNDNISQTGSGGVTYDKLREPFAKVEDGDYFDPNMTVVLAHGTYKDAMRGVKDDEGRPIFQQGQNGVEDRVFGYPVYWSNALRTSGVQTDRPSGNPLLIVGNRDFLILGIRSGPEFATADPDSGVGFLSDEAIVKGRARRGFNIGHEKAFAILEDNS